MKAIFDPSVKNPDAVVALAVAAFSKSSSINSDALRIQTFDSHNEHYPHSTEHTKAVLNAIADLCVVDKEVVAVGLRLSNTNGNLQPEILIATNDTIPSEVITQHLSNVWDRLRELSTSKFSSAVLAEELKIPSPKQVTPSSKTDPLYDEIFRRVYSHSYLKNQKRFKKWWPTLDNFVQDYKNWKAGNQDGAEVIKVDLIRDFLILIGVLRVFNQKLDQINTDEWHITKKAFFELKRNWEKLLSLASRVLDDATAPEIWARNIGTKSMFKFNR